MDTLNRYTRDWERRLSNRDPIYASRTTLADVLRDPGVQPLDGDAGRTQFETGRCVLVVTPRELVALRAAAGATSPGDVCFALLAVEVEQDGVVAFDPVEPGRLMIATADVVEIVRLIGDSPVWLFDRSAQALLVATLATEGAALPEGRVRLLAERGAAAGETAIEDLHLLGRDGRAMLSSPQSLDAVTPLFACSWMAETIASLFVIETERNCFIDGSPRASLFCDDELAEEVRTAAQLLPLDHRAAACQVLQLLLPPIG
jgi:hypothetical protein